MGHSQDDRRAGKAGIEVLGLYKDAEAVARLGALEPDLVWLASIWPETYSYTLSIALEAACPVIAFDIGAIAARLRRIGREKGLMPLSLSESPEKVSSVILEKLELFREAKAQPEDAYALRRDAYAV